MCEKYLISILTSKGIKAIENTYYFFSSADTYSFFFGKLWVYLGTTSRVCLVTILENNFEKWFF